MFIIQLILNASVQDQIKISIGEKNLVFKKEELLKRRDLVEITLKNPPEFLEKGTKFKAIEFNHLLKALLEDANFKIEERAIRFQALDGYSGLLDGSLFVGQKSLKAYVAIEDEPWSQLKKGSSPGPFMLLWQIEEGSDLKASDLNWPYQLASFKVEQTVAELFPNLVPEVLGSNEKEILNRGFKIFQTNCFSCHKLNGSGFSEVGPDLNLPMSPVSYFQADALKKLIRDPKSVRNWSGLRMSGFSKEKISDSDLESLITYLKNKDQFRSKI